jgi:large subunit ribosomal protein L22
MKEARAVGNYLRIAPRKARLVVDLIRGCSVNDAMNALAMCRKRGVQPVRKILVSAMANAAGKEKPVAMRVKEAYVDEGPTLKRYMPRAMGRATQIRKRTSRITIVLREQEPAEKPVKAAKEQGKTGAAKKA